MQIIYRFDIDNILKLNYFNFDFYGDLIINTDAVGYYILNDEQC